MLLNDVHSQINPTDVAEVVRPTTLQALCEVVKQARREGVSLSVAGVLHAMGGQHFATQPHHVDMTGLTRVLMPTQRQACCKSKPVPTGRTSSPPCHREQVLRAHPQIESFLERKRHVDPQERFTSDRYRHHAALMDQA